MRFASVAFLLLTTWGCGGTTAPSDVIQTDTTTTDTPSDVTPDPATVSLGASRLEVRGGAFVDLLPVVHADGSWQGKDAACATASGALRCPIASGVLVVTQTDDGTGWKVTLEASEDTEVKALGFVGEGTLEGATSWLSNGFQSWSQSGVVKLMPAVPEALLESDLLAQGDEEVLREGTSSSYWFTWVSGGDVSLVAGVTTSEHFKSWIGPSATDQGLSLRLISGLTGERVMVKAGETLSSETWHIGVTDDLHAGLRAYAAKLTSRRTTQDNPPAASVGWNSWYELWDSVDAEAVLENATIANAILKPYQQEGTTFRIVIDDGWQVGWGDWQPNEKFPEGLDGLASTLKAQGFDVGVWLAPMLVHEDSPLVAAHPEWFMPDATWTHPQQGKMRILDVTHPEAAAHLKGFITTIVGWGYDFLKIDFLFAATFEGTHETPMTGMAHLHLAMRLIREAAGEKVQLVAVGAPHMGTLPYVDVWRVGGDIAFNTFDMVWPFIPNQLRSIATRWAICEITLCDADPLIMRVLPKHEIDLGAWVVAAGGGALFLSDDLRSLPDERKGWGLDEGRYALGHAGTGAVPEDLVPANPPEALTSPVADYLSDTNSHVVPVRWTMQDKRRIAFNIEETPITVEGNEVPARSVVMLTPAP